MKKIRFYKELDNRWYVDLPDWTGSKADLEMVAGADTMLEHITEGNNEVYLNISGRKFENCDVLELMGYATDIGSGAYYKIKKYRGVDINLEMWLCDVTIYVLGGFPSRIFIAKAD